MNKKNKKPIKVLVVDEDETIFTALNLHSEFQVTYASSIDSAIEYSKNTKYDLILFEPFMNDTSFIYSCEKIRGKINVDTQIMIVSVMLDLVDKFKAINAGADEYVVKPVYIDELIRRIKQSLR